MSKHLNQDTLSSCVSTLQCQFQIVLANKISLVSLQFLDKKIPYWGPHLDTQSVKRLTVIKNIMANIAIIQTLHPMIHISKFILMIDNGRHSYMYLPYQWWYKLPLLGLYRKVGLLQQTESMKSTALWS